MCLFAKIRPDNQSPANSDGQDDNEDNDAQPSQHPDSRRRAPKASKCCDRSYEASQSSLENKDTTSFSSVSSDMGFKYLANKALSLTLSHTNSQVGPLLIPSCRSRRCLSAQYYLQTGKCKTSQRKAAHLHIQEKGYDVVSKACSMPRRRCLVCSLRKCLNVHYICINPQVPL